MRCRIAAVLVVMILATSSATGAEEAAVTLRLWNSDLFSDARTSEPSGGLRPISIVGARNGTFSGRVIAESPAPIKGLRASAGKLTKAGVELPSENVLVRYAVAWDRNSGRYRPRGLDILLESSPAEVPTSDGRAMAAVWLTVKVPRDAKPGTYSGSMTVEAVGLSPTVIPVEFEVVDWALPATQDFRTWVGMIQSPDSLALEYEVPLWSEQHWQLIAKSFGYMKEVGCRNVYIPILCGTNFGNEQSMVRWVKKGEYEYDFSIMDKYLDVAEQNLGTPKMVTFQVWELYLAERSLERSVKTEEVRAARQALMGKGPRVTVVDPETGEMERVYLPRFEDPKSKTLWQPLFAELRKRMRHRELEETMMLGMVSDVWPSKEEVAFLDEVSGGLPWASHAHPGRLQGKPAVGNRLLHEIADMGYQAHVYDLGYQVNPDASRRYGWRNPALVVRFARNGWPNSASFLQMRLLPAFNITGDQRGIGRLGADVWYVVKDKRGRRVGAVYHRYPDANWRNLDIENWLLAPALEGPVATARLENLREGVQECEARILIEHALLDLAKRKQLGDELAQQCRELLDERQRAMWRTIWSNEAELNSLDVIHARHPIEAIWHALTKEKGKELPGYWDGIARKMRSEEEAKGRVWFAASGWQARNQRLFALAGEVEERLRIAEDEAHTDSP